MEQIVENISLPHVIVRNSTIFDTFINEAECVNGESNKINILAIKLIHGFVKR